MARGGYRPGSGPAKGTKYRPRVTKAGGTVNRKRTPKPKDPGIPIDVAADAKAEKLDPLTYMLKVINDPDEKDKARKDRMAVSAAPYCHPRKGEGMGKKDEKNERALSAGKGRFAASKPPQLKVVGK